MNPEVSFFRELPLTIMLRGQLSIVRMAAGFTKAVDPMSGMTVNLVLANKWLSELQDLFGHHNLTDELEVLKLASVDLQKKAALHQAEVSRTQITLENEDRISWDQKSFQFQKEFWATDEVSRARLKVTAWFEISLDSQIAAVEKSIAALQFSINPHEIFEAFSLKPWRLQVEDPLMGHSLIV